MLCYSMIKIHSFSGYYLVEDSLIPIYDYRIMDLKNKILEATATPTIVAFLAYGMRIIIRRQHVTFVSFIFDALSAIIVGIIVGNLIYAYNLPDQVHIAVISLSGMLGPDILAGLLVLSSMFRNSPSHFLIKHISAIRGTKDESKSSEKAEDKPRTNHSKEES